MGKILLIKVKEKGSKGSRSMRYEYENSVNLKDPSQLFLVLFDLQNLFGAPIRKTCLRFLEKDKKEFPLDLT